MKIENTRRFNAEVRGSYEVEVWLKDWECSILIGALKHYKSCATASRKATELPSGTKTFVEKHLIAGLSEALGVVLKSEFADLQKLQSEWKKTRGKKIRVASPPHTKDMRFPKRRVKSQEPHTEVRGL